MPSTAWWPTHRPGYGLVRAFYHDPAIYERDMERVFRRHWHCLAHASVIPNPGDFELFKLDNEAVILTRGADGTIHAMLNVCRHRGAEVCTKPKGNAKIFVCPYHAWTYSNDGSPARRAADAEGFRPLRTWAEEAACARRRRPGVHLLRRKAARLRSDRAVAAHQLRPVWLGRGQGRASPDLSGRRPTGSSRSRTMSSATTAARRIRNIRRRMRWNSRWR